MPRTDRKGEQVELGLWILNFLSCLTGLDWIRQGDQATTLRCR